jgi:hypothetical protein
MSFRDGCVSSAEISAGWTRDLYLLPDRLSEARPALDAATEISGIKRDTAQLKKHADNI